MQKQRYFLRLFRMFFSDKGSAKLLQRVTNPYKVFPLVESSAVFHIGYSKSYNFGVYMCFSDEFLEKFFGLTADETNGNQPCPDDTQEKSAERKKECDRYEPLLGGNEEYLAPDLYGRKPVFHRINND